MIHPPRTARQERLPAKTLLTHQGQKRHALLEAGRLFWLIADRFPCFKRGVAASWPERWLLSPEHNTRMTGLDTRSTRFRPLMPQFTNIAAYRFAALTDLKPLRERLTALCREWSLRGTILLSTEGVNLFVAGEKANVERLLAELRAIPGLADLPVKFSESEHQPFRRMLVKIKKEIISFGVEGVDPIGKPSPKLAPQELKRWLDEGRPLTLLDTRNDYEVKLGTFRNARTVGIDQFREFPSAVAALPEELKHQPIVMFCTGGIRCEKAGPFMEMQGFEQIYQLDGGILKYFEECGAAHYEGECFVFDDRVGLDPTLDESTTVQCYACQSPLTAEEQADPRYVVKVSCPFCYVPTADQQARRIADRHAAIHAATHPLPGRRVTENERPFNIPAAYDGQPLIDCLCGVLGHISREEWLHTCAAGRLLKRIVPEGMTGPAPIAVAADQIVRGGDRYLHVHVAAREPDVNADIRILYEDEAILIVHKPSPLPMHPCGRFNRNTLTAILAEVYLPYNPRPVHRLDANTSGIVLFARTRHFARQLQKQFERGDIEKRYLARVQGHPVQDQFRADAPISDEVGDLGSYRVDWEHGKPASTELRVLERFPDGTSLLQATPITGRTNQIRIHLWDWGHSIIGDPTYLPGQVLGDTQTVSPAAPPLNLLAWRLSFVHPQSRERVTFEAERPAWATSPAKTPA